MPILRQARTIAALAVLMVAAATACGGNDTGPSDAAPTAETSTPLESTDDGGDGGDDGGDGGDDGGDEQPVVGGLSSLDGPDEVLIDGAGATVTSEVTSCHLEPQENPMGGTITAAMTADGVTAAGRDIDILFTQYGDDTSNQRDGVGVDVDGDWHYADLDPGTVVVEGNVIWLEGASIPLVGTDSSVTLSFRINCPDFLGG